jgi:hypothetical protein
MFADGIIIYIKNPKELTKISLETNWRLLQDTRLTSKCLLLSCIPAVNNGNLKLKTQSHISSPKVKYVCTDLLKCI